MEAVEELALGPCTSSQYLRPFRLRYRQNGTKKFWDFMRTHDSLMPSVLPNYGNRYFHDHVSSDGTDGGAYLKNKQATPRELERVHSVSVLIFNSSRQCFLLVKQFRPAVYMCEMERHHPQDFQSKDQDSWCPLLDPLPATAGVTYELCAGIVDEPDLSLEETACKEVLEECGYDVPITNLKRITSYRSGVGVTGSKQTLFYAEVTDQMKTGEGGGQPEEGELIEVVEIPLQDSMKFAFDEHFPKTMGVIFSFMWFQNNVALGLLEK